ncbi:hypothetical protein EVAR_60367_1 [Eumeta japonica]|uniref:Uncharacterized protein n=1 Tax=Eumeta variegata TaxID=151549 RepID=A0A4C1Z6D4_EUMVA|nr:hypothetical protein EVAR_60367_1 [Eumeta japonica]
MGTLIYWTKRYNGNCNLTSISCESVVSQLSCQSFFVLQPLWLQRSSTTSKFFLEFIVCGRRPVTSARPARYGARGARDGLSLNLNREWNPKHLYCNSVCTLHAL